MILKLANFIDGYAIRIIGNIREVIKNRTINDEHIHIFFSDDRECETLILSEKTSDGAYKDLYDWVYLMNNKGETIEKIA